MADKIFDFESNLTIQEILTAQLRPHVEYLQRPCPSLPDDLFLNSGINWIISQNKTCREFLQYSEEVFDNKIPRSTFSDAMHSQRRLELVQEVTRQHYISLDLELSADKVDYLSEFKELEEYNVFSVDGHYIDHCSHTEKDGKGKHYAAGNLYALNMRNGLMHYFACVSDGSEKNHEMPIFRERMAIENSFYNDVKKKTIWISDRAFIDHRWWIKQKRKGNYVISRSKKNNSIIYCGDFALDKDDPVNAGVVSDRAGGFSSSGAAMRIIEYIDPETGDEMTFYTTLGKEVRPGVVCWLYFLRWKIEKVFDSFKNSFKIIKAWATKKRATQIQGHFICLVYNFIQFLLEKTKKHGSCEDEKAEKKYAGNLKAREIKAEQAGRFIHPLIYTSRRISRISNQFFRSVKNYFFSEKPVCALLPIFVERLIRYL